MVLISRGETKRRNERVWKVLRTSFVSIQRSCCCPSLERVKGERIRHVSLRLREVEGKRVIKGSHLHCHNVVISLFNTGKYK